MAVVNIINKIAYDTAKNTIPDMVVFGEVISASHVIIKIDNGINITEEFIYITNNVVNHNVSVNVETHGVCSGHTENNLKNGDSVILIKCFGGQKFALIGRCI